MPRSRVTIRDVARQAGVSHQTVSRVINDSAPVSAETRQRVESAIAALDYRPNVIAQFMAQGRTRTLACLAPSLSDYTFAAIIDAAQKQARRRGYFLVNVSAPDEAEFAALVDQLASSGRTEGFIVLNPFADGRHTLVPADFPVVYVGSRPRQIDVDTVGLDDLAAGRIVAEKLIGLGHRQIAVITGPSSEDCTRDRGKGFNATLTAAGLESDQRLTFEGDWTADTGHEAVRHFLSSGLTFTAIFAQNDRMAVGAMKALSNAGFNIPEDVSIIGVDDMPLAAYFCPPLTTVRQDLAQIGVQAADLLIRRIEQPDAPYEHTLFPVKMIDRESSTSLSPEVTPKEEFV